MTLQNKTWQHRLYTDQPQQQQQTQQQIPAQKLQYMNPMDLINPYYTRQQAQDSLAPMEMYLQYMQTGQLPQAQSSFSPFTPPSPVYAPVSTQEGAPAEVVARGGK